jgi:branched-chain amino acid transport system substrate-binding protein
VIDLIGVLELGGKVIAQKSNDKGKNMKSYKNVLGLAASLSFVVYIVSIGFAMPVKAENLPMGISADTIKIGYHSGMTGGAAFMGYDALKGLETMAFSVNDGGGIHGRKFQIVWADDGYDPAKAIAADKKFAEVDKVFAEVGNVGTTNGIASAKTLEKLEIPFIAPAGYSIQLHQPVLKFTYMLSPSWAVATEIVGNYLIDQGIKKIGIIFQDDEAGREASEGIAKAVKDRTGAGVTSAPFERGAVDFSTQVLACKSAGAEVVVTVAPQGAVASVLREGKKLDYKFRLYGSTAAADPKVIELAGKELAEGMRAFVFNPSPDETTPGMVKMKEQAAKYHPGYNPGFAFMNAYGGMLVLVDALKRSGRQFTKDDFLKAMNSTTKLESGGFFNPITFTPTDHSGHNYIKIVEFREGKFNNVTEWIGVPKK